MKKVIKVLRGALVLGEEWSMYQNKMLNNLKGGGVNSPVKPKKVPPPE